MRVTEDEFKALQARLNKGGSAEPVKEVKSKYRSTKKTVDGIEFDSAKEARRYIDLKGWQDSGQIKRLEHQRAFDLEVNGHHICSYVADFCYEESGLLVVEDVKSKVTRKLPSYVIKKKLMAAVLGITIVEV